MPNAVIAMPETNSHSLCDDRATGSGKPMRLKIHGPAEDRTIDLRWGKSSLGSSEGCDIRIAQPGVAPVHCLLMLSPGCAWVYRWATELQLNGESITCSPIIPGDILSVGPVNVELVDTSGPSDSTERPSNSESVSSSWGQPRCPDEVGELVPFTMSPGPQPPCGQVTWADWSGISTSHRDHAMQSPGESERSATSDWSLVPAEILNDTPATFLEQEGRNTSQRALAAIQKTILASSDHSPAPALTEVVPTQERFGQLSDQDRRRQAEIFQLETSLETVVHEIQELTTTVETLRQTNELLNQESLATQEEIARLTRENESLLDSRSALVTGHERLETDADQLRPVIMTLRESYDALHQEKQVLSEQCDQFAKHYVAAHQEVEGLREQNAQLLDGLMAVTADRDHLQQVVKQAQEEAIRCSQEAVAQAADAAHYQEEIARFRQDNSLAWGRVAELFQENTKLAAQQPDLNPELVELREENEQLRVGQAQLTDEIAAARAEFNHVTHERNRLQDEVRALTEEVHTACEAQSDLVVKCTRSIEEINVRVRENAALRTSFADIKSENITLSQRQVVLEASLADTRSEVVALQAQIEELKDRAHLAGELEQQLALSRQLVNCAEQQIARQAAELREQQQFITATTDAVQNFGRRLDQGSQQLIHSAEVAVMLAEQLRTQRRRQRDLNCVEARASGEASAASFGITTSGRSALLDCGDNWQTNAFSEASAPSVAITAPPAYENAKVMASELSSPEEVAADNWLAQWNADANGATVRATSASFAQVDAIPRDYATTDVPAKLSSAPDGRAVATAALVVIDDAGLALNEMSQDDECFKAENNSWKLSENRPSAGNETEPPHASWPAHAPTHPSAVPGRRSAVGSPGPVAEQFPPIDRAPECHEEEAIEEYIASMMRRLCGTPASDQSHEATGLGPANEPYVTPPPRYVSRPAGEQQCAENSPQARPRTLTSERRSEDGGQLANLSALRQLANESARQAISAHTSRQHRHSAVWMFVATTVFMALTLTVLIQMPRDNSMYFSLVCLLLVTSVGWGGLTINSVRKALGWNNAEPTSTAVIAPPPTNLES